ncbi:hypothetical protein MRB53_034792 [Persea americana]|uniref:Uncharacterized protein n=1 Tax=Persea americana TaxID=3435 RepID=A0ACC2K2W1_PERAE|nr:hypothetical protein MRB53_034792 [Persea americana]
MLSYARVLVNLDVAKSYPRFLSVELESDATLEVEVLYENIPYSECLSTGHLSTNCPYRVKLALLKSPTQAALLKTPPTIVDAGSASVPEVSANATKVPVVISISEVSGSLALVSEDSVSLATLAIAPIISGPPTLTIAALCDTTLPKTSNYSSDLPVVNNPIHVR